MRAELQHGQQVMTKGSGLMKGLKRFFAVLFAGMILNGYALAQQPTQPQQGY
jgi:hypothetical protein